MSQERRKLYSERNGYKPFSEMVIYKRITPEIQNALYSCFDRLYTFIRNNRGTERPYWDLQRYVWTRYLNQREGSYRYGDQIIHDYLGDDTYKWYEKFDIIEESLHYLRHILKEPVRMTTCFEELKEDLNSEFERLNFGHRVVDEYIIDIISEQEIKSVEDALECSDDQVQEHFRNAIMLLAQRPDADYRNSIKESISAVEAFCRKETSEGTLGKALKKLENKGVNIHPKVKSAFEQLYAYTNDGGTGIRHAMLDDSYVPTNAEATFMLVSCSALINYLQNMKGNI